MASDVAACDATKTHCCLSASAACEQFCAANHQKWTGKFGSDTPSDKPSTSSGDDSRGTSANACSHSCKEASDCPTISCQCKHATAPHVAACDVATKCCGDARVVCEHFCKAQKDQWTGKVVDDAPHDDAPLVEDPDVDVE